MQQKYSPIEFLWSWFSVFMSVFVTDTEECTHEHIRMHTIHSPNNRATNLVDDSALNLCCRHVTAKPSETLHTI